MSDFEAEIRNSIRALTTQVTAMGNSLKKTKDDGKKMGDELQGAFRRGAAAVTEAKIKQDAFNRSVQQTGQALQKIGGPLGAIIGQLTGGAGMANGFGRVAVAAGIIGVAIKVLNSIMQTNVERTKLLISAQKDLRQAAESANKTIKSQAMGAANSQGANIRKLGFRSGDGAIAYANEIAKAGITTTEDAQAGVAAAFTLNYGDKEKTAMMRGRVVDAASVVADSGEGTLEATVNKIISDPVMLSRLEKEGSRDDVAARVIVENRGQVANKTNLSSAKEDISLRGTSKMANQIRVITGIHGEMGEAGQGLIASGVAAKATREQMSIFKSPETAEMLEVMKKNQESNAELEKLARAQNWFFQKLFDLPKNAAGLVGVNIAGGSYQSQLQDQQTAQGQATFSPDR